VVRTGDEPAHARSPLGLRLALTIAGTVLWAVAAAVMLASGMPVPGEVFAVIAVLSALNAAFVVHRMRQGPHWQPGRSTPPYRPVTEPRPERVREPRPPIDEHTRARRYLIIMGTCLGLLVLAWGLVRLWSVPLAIGMSMVAMVLPPIAAVIANQGWDRH
jgi:peptidoglycan/LPS O-acetylase OafA/YrhL